MVDPVAPTRRRAVQRTAAIVLVVVLVGEPPWHCSRIESKRTGRQRRGGRGRSSTVDRPKPDHLGRAAAGRYSADRRPQVRARGQGRLAGATGTGDCRRSRA
jgi:hypothetical protein